MGDVGEGPGVDKHRRTLRQLEGHKTHGGSLLTQPNINTDKPFSRNNANRLQSGFKIKVRVSFAT